MDLIAGVELVIAKTGWLGLSGLVLYLGLLLWLVCEIARGLWSMVKRARRWRQASRTIRHVEGAAYREYQPRGQVVQLQSRAQRRRAEVTSKGGE